MDVFKSFLPQTFVEIQKKKENLDTVISGLVNSEATPSNKKESLEYFNGILNHENYCYHYKELSCILYYLIKYNKQDLVDLYSNKKTWKCFTSWNGVCNRKFWHTSEQEHLGEFDCRLIMDWFEFCLEFEKFKEAHRVLDLFMTLVENQTCSLQSLDYLHAIIWYVKTNTIFSIPTNTLSTLTDDAWCFLIHIFYLYNRPLVIMSFFKIGRNNYVLECFLNNSRIVRPVLNLLYLHGIKLENTSSDTLFFCYNQPITCYYPLQMTSEYVDDYYEKLKVRRKWELLCIEKMLNDLLIPNWDVNLSNLICSFLLF